MTNITHYPLLVFVVFFILLWLTALVGRFVLWGRQPPDKELREHFGIIIAAALTLSALVIGFSFSMATNRYDERKNFEEAEANAIGTEYVRADLLPEADSIQIKKLLKSYLDQRIAFYLAHDDQLIQQINTRTTGLQTGLWAAIKPVAARQPNAITALAVSGMNDVLNSQSYSQAMFWNRIPISAWALMLTIGIVCNLLVGYGSRSYKAGTKLLPILPLMGGIAFMFIADIDAPRHGIIRVKPQNLISLAESIDQNRAETAPSK